MLLHEPMTARRSCRNFSSAPIALSLIERLLRAGQSVTDGAGNRAVPSAHALHPIQMNVVAGRIDGIDSGIYAVNPHDLELNIVTRADVRNRLQDAAYDEQPWIGQAAAIIILGADMLMLSQAFAAQAPYGMRGYRYAHIEAGGVLQNMALQAAQEDLGAVLVAGFRDEAVASVLQLAPYVLPIALLCVGRPA